VLGRLRTSRLFLIAVLLVLLGLALAVYPTVSWGRALIEGSLRPLATFQTGEPFRLVDPDPYSGYILGVEVDTRNAPTPPIDTTVLDDGGDPVPSRTINTWRSLMGREYKLFLEIDQPGDGVLEIVASADETEDLQISRDTDDVAARATRRMLPLWILAGVPVVLAIGVAVYAIVRGVREGDKMDLNRTV